MVSLDLNKIKDDYGLSDEDMKVIEQSATGNTAGGIQAGVAAQIIGAKQNRNAVENLAQKFVVSNKNVADSNKNHLMWMKWLTVVIAVAAALDIALRWFFSK